MKKNLKKLYLRSADYNRAFILQQVLKMLAADDPSFKVIIKSDDTCIYLRTHDDIIEKQHFNCCCCSWCAVYVGFIYNHSYYYFSLNSNNFFDGTYCRIILDDNDNYVGARYCYNDSLFKKDADAIKLNYFKINSRSRYDVWNRYSNKTLLKYARYYYNNYFKTIFLNMRDAEIIKEKKRVANYFNDGSHIEYVYDKNVYNIYKKH